MGAKLTTVNYKIKNALEKGQSEDKIISRLKVSAKRLGQVKSQLQKGHVITQYV